MRRLPPNFIMSIVGLHIGLAIFFALTSDFQSEPTWQTVVFGGIAVFFHIASPVGLLTKKRIGVKLALIATAIDILYFILVVWLAGSFALGTAIIDTDGEPVVLIAQAAVWAVLMGSPVVVALAGLGFFVFVFRRLWGPEIRAWSE